MPTKRTKATRGRAVLTLDSLLLTELLCFYSSWRPPADDEERPFVRWRTWEEFMADYVAVREEFMASDMGKPTHRRELPFAEWLVRTYGEGGPPALEQVVIHYSPYPAVMPQPKYLVRYWEER